MKTTNGIIGFLRRAKRKQRGFDGVEWLRSIISGNFEYRPIRGYFWRGTWYDMQAKPPVSLLRLLKKVLDKKVPR